jgi:hypothetical protein
VGNGGETVREIDLAERWLKTLLKEACKQGSNVNYITDSTWRSTLLKALQSALQLRGDDFNALHPSILELDRRLAEKYRIKGVDSVLQHILNNLPPSIPPSKRDTSNFVSSNVHFTPIGWGQSIGAKKISGTPLGWG